MRPLVAALALAGAMMVSSCGLIERSHEIRSRITIRVNTPDGVRSTSGVWSSKLTPDLLGQKYHPKFRGEAIPLSLPGGRMLVALLDFSGPNNEPIQGIAQGIAGRTLPLRYAPYSSYPKGMPTSGPGTIDYLKEHYRGRIKLDCQSTRVTSECPLLVAFHNPADPTSVFALDPDDLARDLGPGYGLEGFYLQITDDPPSRQLGRQFDWLNGRWDRYLGAFGPAQSGSLAQKLNLFSFRQWDT